MVVCHSVTLSTCACRLEMPQRETDKKKSFTLFELRTKQQRYVWLVLKATQFKGFCSHLMQFAVLVFGLMDLHCNNGQQGLH